MLQQMNQELNNWQDMTRQFTMLSIENAAKKNLNYK